MFNKIIYYFRITLKIWSALLFDTFPNILRSSKICFINNPGTPINSLKKNNTDEHNISGCSSFAKIY